MNKNENETTESKIWSFFNSDSRSVLVMDPCPLIRFCIGKVLEELDLQQSNIYSVAKTLDIPDLLEHNQTNLLIMDIFGETESVADGFRTIIYCVKRWPEMPILVYTDRQDMAFLKQLFLIGVWSICLKNEPLTSLKQSLRDVFNGLRIFSPMVQRAIDENTESNVRISLKEITVLDHIFLGYTVTRTAQLLNRDIRTISAHKRSAMAKLGYINDADMYKRGIWMLRQT